MDDSGKYIKAKCSICVKETCIKGLSSVNSNFLKHIKRKHNYADYEEYKKRKLKQTDKASEKQTKIEDILGPKKVKGLTQSEFDSKLLKFVVCTMAPISIVDHPSFKDLFTGSGNTVMSRRSLVRKIEDEYEVTVTKLKSNLNNIQYVCTTADIWSTKRRSYLGVTCHWIDTNLGRHSATLACRRFSGTHSYDRVADLLEEIHLQYNLCSPKVVATVTDNGSNFVKAFAEYGLKLPISENEEYDSEAEDEDAFNFVNFTDSASNIPQSLPKHYRCASHTLNLLATTDLNKAINGNVALKSRHEKAIQKCNILWHKASRPKSAEVIQKVLGHTLSYPTITRWNSFYNSVNQIVVEKEKLKGLFQKLEINDSFRETEIQYLEEYCTLLKPIAESLNFLQGECNTFYGYLLPTILSLKVKLEKLRIDVKIKNIKVILDRLLVSLEKRFSNLFIISENSHDAIIAATTIPAVKLRWLNVLRETDKDADSRAIIKIIVNSTYTLFDPEQLLNNSPNQANEHPDLNEFFDFKEDTPLLEESGRGREMNDVAQLKAKIELELMKYLEDKRQNLDMIKDYKLIKEIFLKYNTGLPSSAAVERLFSFATFMNSPRRNALSDRNFEHLVFLKGNIFMD